MAVVIVAAIIAIAIAITARLNRAELTSSAETSVSQRGVPALGRRCWRRCPLSVGDNQRPLLPMRMQRITAPHVTPALSSFNAMHATVTLAIFSAAGWRRAKAWLVNLLHHVHLPPQRPQARFCRTGIAVWHTKTTVQQRCVLVLLLHR